MPLELIGVTGETARLKLGTESFKGGFFTFLLFRGGWPESRATRHVSLPGPLIAVDIIARFVSGQRDPRDARATSLTAKSSGFCVSLASVARSALPVVGAVPSADGVRRASARTPRADFRVSVGLSVRAGDGGNGRGDGDPRDGARAPGVVVYGRLARRARAPHPKGAARLRTRVLSDRQSTRPTRPSCRARRPRRRASFPDAAPRGRRSADARARRAPPCRRPAGRQGRRRGLGILLWK